MNLILAPAKMYEINGEVTKIFTASASAAVGNNTLVSGVSGKRIRVHGWDAQTDKASAVPGEYFLSDGSGGTNLTRLLYAPIYTAVPWDKIFIDAGYFETSTGTALGVTVAVSNVKVQVHYSVYTP